MQVLEQPDEVFVTTENEFQRQKNQQRINETVDVRNEQF